jgi:hypothetical protein
MKKKLSINKMRRAWKAMKLAHILKIKEAILYSLNKLHVKVFEVIESQYCTLLSKGMSKTKLGDRFLTQDYKFKINLLTMIENDVHFSNMLNALWKEFTDLNKWWNNSNMCIQVEWNKQLPLEEIRKEDEHKIASEMFEAWKAGLTESQKKHVAKFTTPNFVVQLLEENDTKKDRVGEWHLDCEYGHPRYQGNELILVWTDCGEKDNESCGTLFVDNSFIFELQSCQPWKNINTHFIKFVQKNLGCSEDTAKRIQRAFESEFINILRNNMISSGTPITHVKHRHIANVPCQHLHRSSNKTTKYRNHIVISVSPNKIF